MDTNWFLYLLSWIIVLLAGAMTAGYSGKRYGAKEKKFSESLFTCFATGYVIGSLVTFIVPFIVQ